MTEISKSFKRVCEKFVITELNKYKKEDVLQIIHRKTDAFINMPTGFGKSLIYQVFAACLSHSAWNYWTYCCSFGPSQSVFLLLRKKRIRYKRAPKDVCGEATNLKAVQPKDCKKWGFSNETTPLEQRGKK